MTREWCAQEIVSKALSSNTGGRRKELSPPYVSDGNIGADEWLYLRDIAIGLVEKLGVEYIGIFERAEAELQKARDRCDSIEKMRMIAAKRELKRNNQMAT